MNPSTMNFTGITPAPMSLSNPQGMVGAPGGGQAPNVNMQQASADYIATARETMAFQMMAGRINQQQGFVTAITNGWEAQGQAAKGRGEASKQLV